MVEITADEWSNWKQEKVTKEFLNRLYKKREQLKEGLAEGQAGDSQKEIHEVIGQCQAYKDAINYAFVTFEVLRLEETEDNAVQGEGF